MTIKKNKFELAILIIVMTLFAACEDKQTYYAIEDFDKVPKIDAHFHYFSMDDRYIDFFNAQNFKIVSPNVDSGYPVDDQLNISNEIIQAHPEQYAFLGTFSVENFGKPDFEASIIRCIEECMDKGASGIKIWKNIGMTLRDQYGRYVMADDPAFDSVFIYLEKNQIPLLAHLGEPKNCWLPLEEMTLAGDRSYYEEHPQYHMYIHPEMPSYEDQISARDNLLGRYPDLIFIGAHLGSLEWDVDKLAERLDKYPNFKVDMAARIGHLKNQSVQDRDHVRNFLIRYKDRLLYATDMSVNDLEPRNFNDHTESIYLRWLNDFMYLATDTTINEVQGLNLPKEVIDKIYYDNAKFLFL